MLRGACTVNFLHDFQDALCDIIARNALFLLVTGDFNARATKWWRYEVTANEDTKIGSLTSYGLARLYLSQLIFFQILLRALTFFLQTSITLSMRVDSPISAPKIIPSNCFFSKTQVKNEVPSVIWKFNFGLWKC